MTRRQRGAEREKKKERKPVSFLPLLLLLCLLWCVFLLSVYQNVRPDPPLMNYSAAPPPPAPGPNPRLCVAVVPVRLQGSGLLHRAGRCHCHTHISVISPVIFLQWNYSKSTKCRCIDLILFSFFFFVRCLLRKMPLYRLPGVPWHLMAFFFTPLMVCSDLHCSIELIVILLFIHILRFPSKMCEIS